MRNFWPVFVSTWTIIAEVLCLNFRLALDLYRAHLDFSIEYTNVYKHVCTTKPTNSGLVAQIFGFYYSHTPQVHHTNEFTAPIHWWSFYKLRSPSEKIFAIRRGICRSERLKLETLYCSYLPFTLKKQGVSWARKAWINEKNTYLENEHGIWLKKHQILITKKIDWISKFVFR